MNVMLGYEWVAISTAISRRDRRSAIGAACASFHHDITSVHDEEIQDHYADSVLCKHIAFLVCQASPPHPSSSSIPNSDIDDSSKEEDELGYACSALEMVCRASAPVLSKSFDKLGPELLDILLSVLSLNSNSNSNSNNPNTNTNQRRSSCMAIQKVTKILCHYARVGSTVEVIAHHPGILKVLKDILETRQESNTHTPYPPASPAPSSFDKSMIDDASYINALWMLGNLACAPPNMSTILQYPGLEECLLQVILSADVTSLPNSNPSSSSSSLSSPSKITQRLASAGQAIRIFLNLSWTDDHKTIFASNSKLLHVLLQIVSLRPISPSKRIHHLMLVARQHAIGTLRNIAAVPSPDIKLRLCQECAENNHNQNDNKDDKDSKRGTGILSSIYSIITSPHEDTSLLPTITHHGKPPDHILIKERAIATLYNLICPTTVQLILQYPHPPNDFYSAILDASIDPEQHREGDLKTLLETTLRSLRESVTSDMSCYDRIWQHSSPSNLNSNSHLTSNSLPSDTNDGTIESDDLIQFTSI